MPQAIPYIIYAIGTYVGVNAAVVAIAVIVASAIVSGFQARKARRAARDAYNASLEDRLVMTATANASRSRVYGRTRNVDGVVFKGTHGAVSQFYTLAVVVAGHEIDGVERIYFNDVPVTLQPDNVAVSGGAQGGMGYYVSTEPYGKNTSVSGSVPITISGGSGVVVLPNPPIAGSVDGSIEIDGVGYNVQITGGSINVSGNTVTVTGAGYDGTWSITYQYTVFSSKARVWIYNGGAGQTLFPLLGAKFPTLLTATDKFSGMAIIVAELTYDQDTFAQGVPNISAVMRGAKVLDTRTGVTAWTENPAMIARDWALYAYGGGCTAADINEDAFIAAANACDVSTVFNTTTGNETRPLYQCGIVCGTDVNPDDNFGEMVEAMAGRWGFAGGKIKVVAGAFRAPVLNIDDTWLTDKQGVVVIKDPPKSDLVNSYKPVISNADGWVNGATGPTTSVAYTSTPMPAVRSPAFIAADGQELVRETTMLGVTRNVHAQHICGVLMRDARDGMLVQLPCNLRAWPIELFDVVTLTLPVFGFQAKQFEVLGWKYETTEGVMLTLKETSASIYGVNSGLEVLDAALNTTLPVAWFVPQVTGVSVLSGIANLEDGWPTTRVRVSWSPVLNEAVRQSGSIEIQYTIATETLPAGDWPSVTEHGNNTQATITGLLANTAYLFRVRARNTLGVAGPWSVQVLHVVSPPPDIATPILAPGLTDSVEFISIAGDRLLTRVTVDSISFIAQYDSRITVTAVFETRGSEAGVTADNGFATSMSVEQNGTAIDGVTCGQTVEYQTKTLFLESYAQAGVLYDAVLYAGGQFPTVPGRGIWYRKVRITVELFSR